jgi:hypothetical protein
MRRKDKILVNNSTFMPAWAALNTDGLVTGNAISQMMREKAGPLK